MSVTHEDQAAATQAPVPDPASPDSPACRVRVSFDTEPARYRHWRLSVDGPVATLTLDVAEDGGIVRRLRAEDEQLRPRRGHRAARRRAAAALRAPGGPGGGRDQRQGPDVLRRAPTSGCWPRPRTPGRSTSASSPTRPATGIEDATARSGQTYIAALNGTAAGGGYELALACDEIVLIDDGSSAVSLPEVPLLGVLPGTGGLTRLVDKRGVRRDLRRRVRHHGRGRPRRAGGGTGGWSTRRSRPATSPRRSHRRAAGGRDRSGRTAAAGAERGSR